MKYMEEFMKNTKSEGNIIIAINAMKKIMTLFLGPFLTTYFIKTSQESIVDLSTYYIFSNILLTLTREIRLFNLSDSYIVDNHHQSEFFAIREGILNCGRIVGFLMLLFAGINGNLLILNIVMVILTFSIVATGINILKIEKFEDSVK